MANNTAGLAESEFSEKVEQFLKFMFEATPKLHGPKHPAAKYHQLRRKRKEAVQPAGYARSTIPQRTDKRSRERSRAQYQYELVQYNNHHQRKKAARVVMNEQPPSKCPIPLAELERFFESNFSVPNEKTLADYPQTNAREDIETTLEEVQAAIQAIALDTSPGTDRVLPKTIRDLKAAPAIKAIIDIMLSTGWCPTVLSQGKTVLIAKGGDPADPSNYRPITIYPIVRRVIEKVLDRHLRSQVQLNVNQRGFVNGMPGCHVNARLLNECMLDAKKNKSNCAVVFLDISKAFDRIGHRHVELTLESHGVSANLRRLIVSLLSNNYIRISIGREFSRPIQIKKSVPQGGPLSPMIFNLAINFIYRDICDPEFANMFGYRLRPDQTAVSLTGFADDQAVSSSSVEGALRIVELVSDQFGMIGLEINPRKSIAINISKGRLVTGELLLSGGTTIRCSDKDERVPYLGCSFASELVFDDRIVPALTKCMNNLLQSPLLQRDQKLSILNQYILPKMTFSLQAAPLNKIPADLLKTLEVSIRSTAKGALGLPIHQTPTAMLYAPRKYRGLGLVCAEYEVLLQHFAIAGRLSSVDDELFHTVFSCESEMNVCREALGVQGESVRELRAAVREREFEKWSAMSYSGIGVRHFKSYPKANKFMSSKSGLSCSEWTAALKMNCGYASLAGVPGSQTSNNRCRRCGGEKETIQHVLGACGFGSNRRLARHHKLKYALAAMLRERGLQTIDEAGCSDASGGSRFIDILAFEPSPSRKAYIVDPTVRYEANEEINEIVQAEKAAIYAPCIPDLQRRYKDEFGQRDYEVIGLWLGARGTIGKGLLNFFERFGFDERRLPQLAEQVISESVRIIHNHVYS